MQFENFIYSGDLIIKNDYNDFTFENNKGQSLIDYIIVNNNFEFSTSHVSVKDFHLSDHKNLSIDIYIYI